MATLSKGDKVRVVIKDPEIEVGFLARYNNRIGTVTDYHPTGFHIVGFSLDKADAMAFREDELEKIDN